MRVLLVVERAERGVGRLGSGSNFRRAAGARRSRAPRGGQLARRRRARSWRQTAARSPRVRDTAAGASPWQPGATRSLECRRPRRGSQAGGSAPQHLARRQLAARWTPIIWLDLDALGALGVLSLITVHTQPFFFESAFVIQRKKENTQPKGGMGGRHAATHAATQGFQGEKCGASLRPPSGVYLFLSLFAVSRQFSAATFMPPRGRPTLVLVLSPVNKRMKERKQTTQTRDRGGGQGPHLHEQDFGRTIRGTGGLSCS